MTSQEVINKVAIIPSYILEDDIRLYHSYMAKLPNGSLAIDVGTGLGKSAIALALSNPNVAVLTFETGVYPLDRGWAKSLPEYHKLLLKRIASYKAENIKLFMEDILQHDFSNTPIDLFHVDGEIGVEEEILFYMLPFVKRGGIILVRNADRFSEEGLRRLLNLVESVEQRGKIRVCRKV